MMLLYMTQVKYIKRMWNPSEVETADCLGKHPHLAPELIQATPGKNSVATDMFAMGVLFKRILLNFKTNWERRFHYDDRVISQGKWSWERNNPTLIAMIDNMTYRDDPGQRKNPSH